MDLLTEIDGQLVEFTTNHTIVLFLFSQVPTQLPFFSDVFQFPTLLSGPKFYFNDFVGYIEGTTENEHLEFRKDKQFPSYKVRCLIGN